MWHYRPWKPIVDGKFLPKQNIGKSENEKDQQITAFLPDHPNTLMQNGEFNKVLKHVILKNTLIFSIYSSIYEQL